MPRGKITFDIFIITRPLGEVVQGPMLFGLLIYIPTSYRKITAREISVRLEFVL